MAAYRGCSAPQVRSAQWQSHGPIKHVAILRRGTRPGGRGGRGIGHLPPGILRPVPDRYAIAQVTPHPWEDEHEVNAFAGELASELAARGHRLLVLAPSRSRALVRESRKLIRAARENPETLFDPDGGVRVLGGR